ncbi:MAG: DUF3368 domain-containing protein [Gammaproteobacteria bacterium]
MDILGLGEKSAIQLALKRSIPLLVDEKQARNIAKKLKIQIISTAAILLQAKKLKLINNVKTILDDLLKENYRFSNELVHEILTLAQEN